MAIRCDCHWERVDLDPSLSPLFLRATDAPTCPAHPFVRDTEETAA